MRLLTIKSVERDGDNRLLPAVTTINLGAVLTITRAASGKDHWLINMIGGDYVLVDAAARQMILEAANDAVE